MSSRANAIIVSVLGMSLFDVQRRTRLAENPITAAEAKALAQEAYVFGLPLVYIALQSDQLTNVPKSARCARSLQSVCALPGIPRRKAQRDRRYERRYAVFAREPRPHCRTDGAFHSGNGRSVLADADHRRMERCAGSAGARTVGGKGGNFALVGPKWKGELPSGVTEIRSSTSLTMIGGRTMPGKSDYAAVHNLQDQYRLTPLSKWGTDYTPPATVPVKPNVDVKTPTPDQVFAMPPEVFFGRLNALLVDNPPHPDDAPVMARIAKLGIAPGANFKTESFTEEVRKAIEEGVLAGQEEIKDLAFQDGREGEWLATRPRSRSLRNKVSLSCRVDVLRRRRQPLEDAFYPTDAEGQCTGIH